MEVTFLLHVIDRRLPVTSGVLVSDRVGLIWLLAHVVHGISIVLCWNTNCRMRGPSNVVLGWYLKDGTGIGYLWALTNKTAVIKADENISPLNGRSEMSALYELVLEQPFWNPLLCLEKLLSLIPWYQELYWKVEEFRLLPEATEEASKTLPSILKSMKKIENIKKYISHS